MGEQVYRLSIEMDKGVTSFEPGEWIQGTATWNGDVPPKSVTVRLVWYSERTTYESSGVADVCEIGNLENGCGIFEFTAPHMPLSFEGRMVSLCWAVELDVRPGKELCRKELVIAPDRRVLTVADHQF